MVFFIVILDCIYGFSTFLDFYMYSVYFAYFYIMFFLYHVYIALL